VKSTTSRGGAVDAVVIGAGHNGLVAAALLADAGWDVLVLEAQAEPGGAVKSADESTSDTRTLGAFLEENLAFNERFYLTGALRSDRNSAERIIDQAPVAPPNIGQRTATFAFGNPSYEDFAKGFVIGGPRGIKFFAGPRDDAFFVNLAQVFDLGAFVELQTGRAGTTGEAYVADRSELTRLLAGLRQLLIGVSAAS